MKYKVPVRFIILLNVIKNCEAKLFRILQIPNGLKLLMAAMKVTINVYILFSEKFLIN